MKSFKQVEASRKDYHRDGTLNSVHRSSLTVPEIDGTVAEISFLNHFLIKRQYPNIACRITAVDREGQRIESRLFPVRDPRVYTFTLTGMVDQPVASYLVEFFAAENLYIPFPAVMVNHRGPNFLNSVHAYNRVLNDVFEDDSINAVHPYEASIDMRVDKETDTFFVFTAGPQHCQGEIQLELTCEHSTHRASVPLEVPRFGNRVLCLRDIFPNLSASAANVLKVRQPAQHMFYGRLLAGQRRNDGAFSANHSYYDSSSTPEYWDDDRASYRLYPYFARLKNVIRMYPIMAPGSLAITIKLYDRFGRELASFPSVELTSPGISSADISIDSLVAQGHINSDDVMAFAVYARPLCGRIPTRINHQLVQGDEILPASINLSLLNPNEFVPEGKAGIAWGQAPIGGGIESWLGIVGSTPHGASCEVEITFYGQKGMITKRNWKLPSGSSISVRLAEELVSELGEPSDNEPNYIWYVVRGARYDLSAMVVSRHQNSAYCSGEHSF